MSQPPHSSGPQVAKSAFADTLSPGPQPTIGRPLYAAKTIDLCVPNDPVGLRRRGTCARTLRTSQTGMVNQAAR